MQRVLHGLFDFVPLSIFTFFNAKTLDYLFDNQAFAFFYPSVFYTFNALLLNRLSLNPISYCRFKYINIYIFQRFELNAISAHARLADFFPIRLD